MSSGRFAVLKQLIGNCTCGDITYIPDPQAFFLSSKSVNEGQVRAARGAEYNTLSKDGKIQP